MSLPRTTEHRTILRREYETQELARARKVAATRGRSLKCGGKVYDPPRHAGEPDSCANTGETCLCDCHDQPDGSASR